MTLGTSSTLQALVDAARQTDEIFVTLKSQAALLGIPEQDVDAATLDFYGGPARTEDLIRMYDRQCFIVMNLIEALIAIEAGKADSIKENAQQLVFGLRQMMDHNRELIARRDQRRTVASDQLLSMMPSDGGTSE